MDDLNLLEAVERYINGQMTPDERVWFEGLRKSNPEIDQLVVEHTFFIQQFHRFDETRVFKSRLNEVHLDLAEAGAIESPRLKGKARITYLYNRYKRTGAIAASIAGVTAVAISALLWSVSPAKAPSTRDIRYLNGKIDQALTNTKRLDNRISDVEGKVVANNGTDPEAPKVVYTTGGTGFLIDPSGYLVTSAHVVGNAQSIAVQNGEGDEFQATLIQTDAARDIAILKITDPKFKAPSALPYAIRKGGAEIAEPVYTLGYPRNTVVYGEGYMAARTGFNGDTLTCQIAIAANPGNSGGPILNRNGEVVGILSAKQTTAEGVVFATQSKYLYQLMSDLRKTDTSFQRHKATAASLRSLDRTQQVKKIQDFVYRVKVS
ncbi:MAG: serine protease [Chitinophagaceae bacterium]|nr:MAG: serine protease [Chitinophagaceae bacterium]